MWNSITLLNKNTVFSNILYFLNHSVAVFYNEILLIYEWQ